MSAFSLGVVFALSGALGMSIALLRREISMNKATYDELNTIKMNAVRIQLDLNDKNAEIVTLKGEVADLKAQLAAAVAAGDDPAFDAGLADAANALAAIDPSFVTPAAPTTAPAAPTEAPAAPAAPTATGT